MQLIHLHIPMRAWEGGTCLCTGEISPGEMYNFLEIRNGLQECRLDPTCSDLYVGAVWYESICLPSEMLKHYEIQSEERIQQHSESIKQFRITIFRNRSFTFVLLRVHLTSWILALYHNISINDMNGFKSIMAAWILQYWNYLPYSSVKPMTANNEIQYKLENVFQRMQHCD